MEANHEEKKKQSHQKRDSYNKQSEQTIVRFLNSTGFGVA